MQATGTVTAAINTHLQGLAEKDSLFAETLKKPGKSIDQCVTYILNQVKKSGNNWFADEEIFAMAVHYYDEDNIDVGAPISGKVVAGTTAKPEPVIETASKKPAKKTAGPDEQIYLF